MGLWTVPLGVDGFATRRRSAEESVRSGIGGSGFRSGVCMESGPSDSATDGDVRLMSSMPPVLDDVKVGSVTVTWGEV